MKEKGKWMAPQKAGYYTLKSRVQLSCQTRESWSLSGIMPLIFIIMISLSTLAYMREGEGRRAIKATHIKQR